MKTMNGYIHSFDTFGTVDGPGIRFVIFLQGCPLRCLYCHNPDTWKTASGSIMSVDEIMDKFDKTSEFTKGGITITGGEPLLQIDFVTELFKHAKTKGIHTALDSSGVTFNIQNTARFDELMSVTDLVLLDIKHIDKEAHKLLTGVDNEPILQFAQYLSDIKKDVWIRHVVIEGHTLDDGALYRLGVFLSSLKNIKALDFIPYHRMGENKYKELNLVYPLKDVPATSNDQVAYALKQAIIGIKAGKRNEV